MRAARRLRERKWNQLRAQLIGELAALRFSGEEKGLRDFAPHSRARLATQNTGLASESLCRALIWLRLDSDDL